MFKTQYRSVDSLNSSPTTSVVAFSASAAASDASTEQGGARITWRWALAYVALVWLGAVLFSHLQQFCAAIYFFQVCACADCAFDFHLLHLACQAAEFSPLSP
jgi:hypothetical protein